MDTRFCLISVGAIAVGGLFLYGFYRHNKQYHRFIANQSIEIVDNASPANTEHQHQEPLSYWDAAEQLAFYLPAEICEPLLHENLNRQLNCRKSLELSTAASGLCCIGLSCTSDIVQLAHRLIFEKQQELYCARRSVCAAAYLHVNRRSLTQVSQTDLRELENLLAVKNCAHAIQPSSQELEIFVTAIKTPTDFWVQLVGAGSVQLIELQQNLQEFYSMSTVREMYKIRKPILGSLVAATYGHDTLQYYRAQIIEILPQYEAVVLRYVDFGDCGIVPQTAIYDLAPKFLEVRCQALHCCLHGIEPKDGLWSNQAIRVFEELCHFNVWKKVIMRPVALAEHSSDTILMKGEHSAQLAVKLLESNGDYSIDIAQCLIDKELAVGKTSAFVLSETQEMIGSLFHLMTKE